MRAYAGYMGEGCHCLVAAFLCYGDEENARIYAVHLTTANQSKMRRAHLVSMDIGADWVENGGTGENPQPEAEKKQAGWVESEVVNLFWTQRGVFWDTDIL